MGKIDKNLILLFDENPRITQTEIAKRLKTSQQVVNYTIKKILREGTITQFAALVDYMKLGFKQYHIFFNTNKYEEYKDELLAYLKSCKNIWWGAKVGSFYDIMLQIVVRDVDELEDFLERLTNKFPGLIKENIILSVIEHQLYNHSFLHKKTAEKHRYSLKETSERVEIDELDYNILKVLIRNCRVPTIELARRFNSTYATIKERIKRMEQKGVILGYRIFHNLKRKKAFLALITFENYVKKDQQKLISQVYSVGEFTHLWKSFGEYNLVIHARCESYEEFQQLFNKVREKNDIIKKYRLIPVFKDLVIDTLPVDLRKENFER